MTTTDPTKLTIKEKVKAFPHTSASWFAGFLGTKLAFWLCNIIWIIGSTFPKLTTSCMFLSQTVIQLVALPAIQMQTVEEARKSGAQSKEEHDAVMSMLQKVEQMLKLAAELHRENQETLKNIKELHEELHDFLKIQSAPKPG